MNARTIMVPQQVASYRPVAKTRYNAVTKGMEYYTSNEMVFETRLVPQVVYDPPNPTNNYSVNSVNTSTENKKEEPTKKLEIPPTKSYVSLSNPKVLTKEQREKLVKDEEEKEKSTKAYERNKNITKYVGLFSLIVFSITNIISFFYEIIYGNQLLYYFMGGVFLLAMIAFHLYFFRDKAEELLFFSSFYVVIIMLLALECVWSYFLIKENFNLGLFYIIFEHTSFLIWNIALFIYRYHYEITE